MRIFGVDNRAFKLSFKTFLLETFQNGGYILNGALNILFDG